MPKLKKPVYKVSAMNLQIDLDEWFTALDAQTSTLLRALAASVKGEALDPEYDDLIVAAITEAAVKVEKIEKLIGDQLLEFAPGPKLLTLGKRICEYCGSELSTTIGCSCTAGNEPF